MSHLVIKLFYTYVYYLKDLVPKINQIYLTWPKNIYAQRIFFIIFLNKLN